MSRRKRFGRIAPAATLLALLATAGVEAQVPAGVEFRVDHHTSITDSPDVGMDASGGFVVTWRNYHDPNGYSPSACRYDALGTPVGPEFTITHFASDPSLAVDARGRMTVVWDSSAPFPEDIRARFFTPSGEPQSLPVQVSNSSGRVPRVAAGRSGSLVVWHGSGLAVMGRLVDATGKPLGTPFSVSTATQAFRSAVAGATHSGSFVVVWTRRLPGGDSDIAGQRLDAAGQKLGAEFAVNASTTGDQDFSAVASDEQGNFLVAWRDRDSERIVARPFDAAASPRGVEFDVGPSTNWDWYMTPPSVAADRAGNFTVVWETDDIGGSGELLGDLLGRRFTAAGVPRGEEFRVNSEGFAARRPRIADDGAGNLVVAWWSIDYPASRGIYARRFGGLVPAGLGVLDGDDGNGVLEVADTFTALTSWRNVTGGTATFQGSATEVAAPAGLVMNLSPASSYVDVANGDVAACGGPCFAGTLTGTRPAGHVDATFLETIVPDTQGQTRRWRLHVGDSFRDVPRTHPFYGFIETLLHHEVTTGCGGRAYCPASSITREQLSAFLLLAKEGPGYLPPACATPVFGDVPASSPFCRWIEELARRGVTAGCGRGNYCPSAAVSREQMAVFVLRTLDPALNPPACTTPVFNDVPASSPSCRWIEELARRGIVTGCGGGNYCPTTAVTREQMAVFLTGTFGLDLYGP